MKCFVMMPFGTTETERIMFNEVYNCINDSVEETGNVICHRADKEKRTGEIIVDIIDSLYNAGIAIADLTNKNPNVFYELGVRHSLKNNTILIAQNIEHVPFDLRQLRVIIYEYSVPGMRLLKNGLIETIKSIQFSERIDNPVRRYLEDKEIIKSKIK
jgi:hypothetical protein